GWGTSLLIPTLKAGIIFRTKLNADGSALEDGTYEAFHSSGDRFRDVAIDANGLNIYTITDAGAVIKLEFVGEPLSTSKFNGNTVSLFPNPANTETTSCFGSHLKEELNVQVFDVFGK